MEGLCARSEVWMRVEVTFYVNLPYRVRKEGKWHYSSCPALDVHSQGPSNKKAEENLFQALQLFLFSCYERGTLAQILRDSGFVPLTPARHGSAPRRRTGKFNAKTMRVPLPFVVDRPREELCPA